MIVFSADYETVGDSTFALLAWTGVFVARVWGVGATCLRVLKREIRRRLLFLKGLALDLAYKKIA
jgi:hypothetical protein